MIREWRQHRSSYAIRTVYLPRANRNTVHVVRYVSRFGTAAGTCPEVRHGVPFGNLARRRSGTIGRSSGDGWTGTHVTTNDRQSDGRDKATTSKASEAVAVVNDPAMLRSLLDRANERLSFYEEFDREIAENVRRSGELMQETLAVRDRMTSHQLPSIERDQVQARLAELDDSLATVRIALDTLTSQVTDLRRIVAPNVANAPVSVPPLPLTHEPSEPDSPAVAPPGANAWDPPRVIELVVHRVTRAALALSLQRHLGGLDPVAGVEAREFAEGILRLQVTARRPLEAEEVTGWEGAGAVTVLQLEPQVIEIEVG